MFFIAQSTFLKALAQAILYSFWQFAILWLLYELIIVFFPRTKAHIRHTISGYLLAIGSITFLICLFSYPIKFTYSNVTVNEAISIPQLFLHPDFFSIKEWIYTLAPYFSTIYLSIILILLIRMLRYFLYANKLTLANKQKTPVNWKLFVQQKAVLLGINKTITLRLSKAIDTPQVIGFLKPVILLPLCCISHLPPLQIEAVLLHELAHIKRNDYFINFFIALASVVFFFNPFTRRLIMQLRNERENACDDWVLQFCYPASEYATALLQLEKSRNAYNVLNIAAAGNERNQLLLRIQRILQITVAQPPRRYIGLNIAIIAIIVIALSITSQKPPLNNTRVIDSSFFLFTNFNESENDCNHKEYNYLLVRNQKNISLGMQNQLILKQRPSPIKQKTSTCQKNNKFCKVAEAQDTVNYVIPVASNTDDNNSNLSFATEETATTAYTFPTPATIKSAIAMGSIAPTQPFVPSCSFEYHYITDSVQLTIEIAQYTAALVEAELLKKQAELGYSNRHKVMKELELKRKLAKKMIQEELLLSESKNVQRNLVLEAARKQQQQYKSSGKKRIVHL